MKTIKDMFEVYRPKSPDEQKFVDKHVTVKQKDRNEVNGKANGDDVFKATNIKTIEREKTRHGYDIGADEKVYEENEFVNEEELIDEGMLGGLFAKKKKVTVGKLTSVKDLPDGEKPFQKMAGQGARNPQPTQRDEQGRTLYQRVTDAKQNRSKMTKEDIINRAIDKYMPEVADIKPLTMEEKLAKRLEGFSEGHTVLLFSLFTNLNEDNQLKMIDACQDREGIIQLIDFALENNGSE
jgi:hypothetical protein